MMIESNAAFSLSDSANDEMKRLDGELRPDSFGSYIGQVNIKKNLGIAIEAAKKRGDVLEHVLLHGAPGLGKTTLANIIASEMSGNLRVTSGPALEKQGDVASIISNLEDGDVLFIDEIHRLKPVVEEVLYTAMEDYSIDIILGKGPAARTMRIDLPKFTLIGATTKMNMISAPLRSRFSNVFRLQFYSDGEISEVVSRSAKILGVDIDQEASMRIAQASRQTPRIANSLLKRARDFAEVQASGVVDKSLVARTFQAIGIDELGLDHVDREIVKIIVEKFNGGPVGLNTLAVALGEEQATIESIYEPFLIKTGLLERTPRGRMVTERAFAMISSWG